MAVNFSLQPHYQAFQSEIKEKVSQRSQNKLRLPVLTRYLQAHWHAFLNAVHHFKRFPLSSLFTICAIGITLALPLFLYTLFANAQGLTTGFAQNMQITLFLKQNLSQEDVNDLITSLQSNTNIASIRYISPEEGLTELREETDLDDVLANLPANPLPPVITISPVENAKKPQEIQALYQQLLRSPLVAKASFDKEWLMRLHELFSVVKRFTYLLEALFIMGTCLVIGVMIRLAQQQHRSDLEVLHLMAASPQYMRRPFLYTGVIYGLGGALIALSISFLALDHLALPIQKLASSYQSQFSLSTLPFEETCAFLLSAVFFSWMSSRLATSMFFNVRKRQ